MNAAAGAKLNLPAEVKGIIQLGARAPSIVVVTVSGIKFEVTKERASSFKRNYQSPSLSEGGVSF